MKNNKIYLNSKSARLFMIALMVMVVLGMAGGSSGFAQASTGCSPSRIICIPQMVTTSLPGPNVADPGFNINHARIWVHNKTAVDNILLFGQVVLDYRKNSGSGHIKRLLTFANGGLTFYSEGGAVEINLNYLNISYTQYQECPSDYRCDNDTLPSNTAIFQVMDKWGTIIDHPYYVPDWYLDPGSLSLDSVRVL